MILCVAQGHRFSLKGAATIEEVGRESLILFDRGSSYNQLIQGMFRQHGIVPKTVMEMDTIEATKKMVEEGLGIALLPKVSTEREFSLGTLCPIVIANATMPRRQISLIFRKNRKHPRAVEAFIELLTEQFRASLPQGAVTGAA